MSTLKNVNVPASLEVEMKGESLFNDGVGIVAVHDPAGLRDRRAAARRPRCVGDRWICWSSRPAAACCSASSPAISPIGRMRLIDDYSIEVLISLALVTATYAHRAAHSCQRPARRRRRRPADRLSRPARCDERPDADLCLRPLDADRRGAEFAALPADRAGGADPALRSARPDLLAAVCDSDRRRRPLHRRRRADASCPLPAGSCRAAMSRS